MAKAKKSNEITGWVGWIFFAGFMMILQGLFNIIIGLTAIFNSEWFVVTTERVLLYDLTAWGWFHLILGFIVSFAGAAIMRGALWARIIGVAAAIISALGALTMVEVYPLWAIILITVDVLIIYAITVHGNELEEVN